MEKRPKKLLDQVREAIRVKHYSIRTEEAYVAWIKRCILFHNKRHPQEMGASEKELESKCDCPITSPDRLPSRSRSLEAPSLLLPR